MSTIFNEQPESRTIVTFRDDGLGARLFANLWSCRLGRILNAEVKMYWPGVMEGYVPYLGKDYSISHILNIKKTYSNLRGINLSIIDGDYPHRDTTPRLSRDVNWREIDSEEARDLAFKESPTIMSTGHRPIIFKNETYEDATRQISEIFNSWSLADILSEALDEYISQFDPQKTIAIHFRRGDVIANLTDVGKRAAGRNYLDINFQKWSGHYFRRCAPIAAYWRAIDYYISKGFKFILFTDSPDAFDMFSEKYPGSILRPPAHEGTGLLKIQVAMLHILAMSRCHTILATQSGFSRLAAMIGNVGLDYVCNHSTAAEFFDEYMSIIRIPRQNTELRTAVANKLPLYKGVRVMMRRKWSVKPDEVLSMILNAE